MGIQRIKGSKWWRFQWRDAAGRMRTKTLTGITDYKLVKDITSKIATESALERHGFSDPQSKRAAKESVKPIDEHIGRWRELLFAGGNKHYADEESALVRRVMVRSGAQRLTDITPGDIRRAIATLPRTRGEGTLSARTKNKAATACKMFCEQMRRDGAIRSNPLSDLKGWNEAVDRRHDRLATEADEATAIINAARASKAIVQGLTGPQRAMLYEIARGTGFRRRTLFGLRVDDLHVDALPPFIRVRATNVKNKQQRDQIISSDLAEMLRSFIGSARENHKLFSPSRRGDTSLMMQHDCHAAGIPFKIGDLFRDFHSWRNTYGTELGRITDNIKVAQVLMGHSTPVLTARYMRPTINDYRGAVSKLPSTASRDVSGNVSA
jgi:integrase